ncbi:DUF2510 domain-containing protein [Streptomyces sp. NRRL F-5123]|uniref:DUF2510 domain-containing protein n=1 Tax=Streptomyces sp. NRRL F-5123 TaxID=1463856 RepID=UPI0004E20A32|nr:DUF2510 domain-containing protein [Streptomyces sp. NRRL F-5123]
MTTSTPPGWYAEPGHTGNSPAMERWWDGSAWTEYTRTAPVPPTAPPVYPGSPQTGYGYGTPAPDRGRRTGTVVIALVAALVLIGAVVAGILVLGKDDNGKDDAKGSPTPSHSTGKLPHPLPSDPGSDGGGSTGGDGGSDGGSGAGDPTKAIDGADAISLPVLEGWQGQSSDKGAGLGVGPYACPGTQELNCTLGGVSSEPAADAGITATTPQAAAEQDIAANAAASYGEDTYGPTTSHQQIKAGAVTVAGQQGYLVRWKVVTQSGTQGYVESLVFPSPTTKRLVVVRFGFDVAAKAPTLADMDKITQGIKTDTTRVGSSSGGTGTGV